MPRVSLVGAGHGGSEDYATLALWWTAESGVDYGSKIEAVCSGNSGLASLMITGVTPNGYAIYAKTGEAFDGTNELTCPQSGGIVLASANGSFSGLACTGSGSTKGMSQTGQDTVVEFNFLTHGGTSDAANQNSTATNKIMRNNVIKGVGNFAFVANSNTFLNQLENNTVIGNSAWGILASNSSVLIQNNFSFGHATNDINSNTGVFVTNATQDTSGNAGLTGFTSAELVDFAGGDYRTKATSTLATAGTGAQGFIGAFLETGGGGLTLVVPSITSGESFGLPDVILNTAYLLPSAITTAESFGVPTVASLDQFIQAISVSSLEAFGEPLILTGGVTLAPTSITSQESLGTPFLVYSQLVLVDSITSEESFGIAIISDGVALVIPVGDRDTYQKIAEYLRATDKFVSYQNNEILLEWLRSEGIDEGSFNDSFKEYWGRKGYVGAYNDRWREWRDS